MQFSDEDVIEGLLTLITDDHSHKVKAAAIEGYSRNIMEKPMVGFQNECEFF